MDYIDYKDFTKKTWQQNHKSHVLRLKEILEVPGHRIDNKPDDIHIKAPCRSKPKLLDQEKFKTDLKLLNTLKTINDRNYKKSIKERLKQIKSLSIFPKKFKSSRVDREMLEGNLIFQAKLNKVKSSFSNKQWVKEYKEARSYGKMISKPHVERRISSLTTTGLVNGNLIDSNSINYK